MISRYCPRITFTSYESKLVLTGQPLPSCPGSLKLQLPPAGHSFPWPSNAGHLMERQSQTVPELVSQ